MKAFASQFGFTLIEVIIVIAIFGVLATLALFFSMDFFRTYAFNSEQVNLASALSKARARSLANINEHEHGVHIESGKITLYQGPDPLTWDVNDPLNEEVQASTSVIIAERDIVFEQLSGSAACTPDCTINISGLGSNKNFTVSPQGAILW